MRHATAIFFFYILSMTMAFAHPGHTTEGGVHWHWPHWLADGVYLAMLGLGVVLAARVLGVVIMRQIHRGRHHE